MKKKLLIFIFLLAFFANPSFIGAQESLEVKEDKLKAQITEINKVECLDQQCTQYKLKSLEDGKQEIEILTSPEEQRILDIKNYQAGDKVLVLTNEFNGETNYFVIDHIRTVPLYFLVGLFIVTVLAVGKLKGLSSLIGLVFSIIVLFAVVIPLILKGFNPLLVGGIGSIVIAVPSIYLSHGFKRTSTIAIFGTLLSIFLVFILSYVFTNLLRLTGYASEESLFLSNAEELDMKGILLTSLIFGGIGILDDVTVSQVSIVKELIELDPKLELAKIYQKAMNIGHDHIASMVNTLFLAYASSAFPLVLLLSQSNASIEEVLNNEPIAEEILRALVGSIGLILAVPLTTAIAAYLIKKRVGDDAAAS